MEIHSSESTTDEAQIRYDWRDFTFHCLKKIPNNFLHSLDLARISAVFSTPPPPLPFFGCSTCSVHSQPIDTSLVGSLYSGVDLIAMWCYFVFQGFKERFSRQLSKNHHSHHGHFSKSHSSRKYRRLSSWEQQAHVIQKICWLEIGTDKNQEDYQKDCFMLKLSTPT